jgi:hypothetical protein
MFAMTLRRFEAAAVFLAACFWGRAGGNNSLPPGVEKGDAKAQHESAKPPRTLIGLQYESFFTKHNVNWDSSQASGSVGLYNGTEEAIPILGKYSSYDANIIRKHEEWFEYLGIDWLLIDWTNFLIATPAWETQQGPTRESEETTELLFKTYRQLQKEGKRPPKFVFMMPPYESASSVPVGIQRLNHLIQWATQHYLDNPEYEDLWLRMEGRPLLNIAAWSSSIRTPGASCGDLAKITGQVVAPGWTVRWMGTQLQDSHVDQCGYWSWMDGAIRQAVTFRNGAPEETVVTPSCFPFAFTDALLATRKGWLDPKAVGRDHGAPYIESWKVAFENRPKVIQIHQWNEFSGQTQGMGPGIKKDIYGDEYNLEFSDDLEPTRLDKCGFRDCGGWGYYYMNLTKALISLYRKETPDITVLALSGPALPAIVKDDRLHLTWNYLGQRPASYTLKVDERPVAENLQGNHFTVDLSKLSAGKHTAQLVANGVHTYFDLSPARLTMKSNNPLPVASAIEFKYAPAAGRN